MPTTLTERLQVQAVTSGSDAVVGTERLGSGCTTQVDGARREHVQEHVPIGASGSLTPVDQSGLVYRTRQTDSGSTCMSG